MEVYTAVQSCTKPTVQHYYTRIRVIVLVCHVEEMT